MSSTTEGNTDPLHERVENSPIENSPIAHPPSLNEIQIRAYRVHHQHGGLYGGYTLEEWLEAEHALDDERHTDCQDHEQVH